MTLVIDRKPRVAQRGDGEGQRDHLRISIEGHVHQRRAARCDGKPQCDAEHAAE